MRFLGFIEKKNGVVFLMIPALTATGFGKDLDAASLSLQQCCGLVLFDNADHPDATISVEKLNDNEFAATFEHVKAVLPRIMHALHKNSPTSNAGTTKELGHRSTGSVTRYFNKDKPVAPSFPKAVELFAVMGYKVTIS